MAVQDLTRTKKMRLHQRTNPADTVNRYVCNDLSAVKHTAKNHIFSVKM